MFGDTLVGLLRKHKLTAVFVCRDVELDGTASVQEAIIDNADCLIQFSESKYLPHIEVLKTRGMHHHRGPVPLDIAL